MTTARPRVGTSVYMMLSLPVIALCLLALPGLTRTGLASAKRAAPKPLAPAAEPVAATAGACITDDNTHDNLSFSFAGAYTFTRCKPSLTLTGTGTIKTSGSVVMLTDNKSDRLISAGFLVNQQTGRATITLKLGVGVFQVITVNQTNPKAVCGC